MSVKDGGPAFPHMYEQVDENVFRQSTTGGMSLRDYMAAKVLPALYRDSLNAQAAAVEAYQVADAMLAEREKGKS